MKILIIGHCRHGKDATAGLIQKHFGFTFESSSEAAARIFIYDELKEKYRYTSFDECYEDRKQHRTEWFDLICEYNKEDKARLAKGILSNSDIYVGMRSNEELQECVRQGLFDLIIGVYNPNKPEEDKSSFDIDIWKQSHIVIPNSGTLDDLEDIVVKLKPIFT